MCVNEVWSPVPVLYMCYWARARLCFLSPGVCPRPFLKPNEGVSFWKCMSVFADYRGRVSAAGSVMKDWLSSRWCQRRRRPGQCRPLGRTPTAACLCWKSACDAWQWTDPRPRPTRCKWSGGRTCGMLGNEIRWDLGAGSWQPVMLYGCGVKVWVHCLGFCRPQYLFIYIFSLKNLLMGFFCAPIGRGERDDDVVQKSRSKSDLGDQN